MAFWAEFGGISIPKIYVLDESREDIADTGRTAGGKERRDAISTPRAWQVETRPIPAATVAALETHLDAIGWGYDAWQTSDMPAPVQARIDAASWSKSRVLGLPGYWALSFRVIEQ